MTLSSIKARTFRTRGLDVSRVRLRLVSQLREWLALAWRRLLGAWVLPADLRTQLEIERGERVLSVGHGPEGDYALVASDRALYHRSGGDAWSRLGWEQITRVSWDAAADKLLISGLDGLAPSRTAVPLRDRGTLPELAQERTAHTSFGRWHVHLAGNRSVLVEIRRRPGAGELVWAVISASDGLDNDSADASADIARAVARLGEHLGVCDPVAGGPRSRGEPGAGSVAMPG